MVIKNNVNTYMTSVDTADKRYLVYGILGIVMILLLECVAVWNFWKVPIAEAIGVALLVQVFIFPASLLTLHLKAYRRRTKLMLYFAYIEDANMKSIKEKYHVCFVDKTGVLFIEKRDIQAYNDWNLMIRVDNLREVKDTIFPEPICT